MTRLNYYQHCEELGLLKALGVKEGTTKANLIHGAATEGAVLYIAKRRDKEKDRSVEDLFNRAIMNSLEYLIQELQLACAENEDDNFWRHKTGSDLQKLWGNYDELQRGVI